MGFNSYISCWNRIINRAESRNAMVFPKLQMGVLNDFVLFLKQESGSNARGMKKSFSKVLHARSTDAFLSGITLHWRSSNENSHKK